MKTIPVVLLILLAACGYNPENFEDGAVINAIEKVNYTDAKGCLYYTKDILHYRLAGEGYFYDKCGKFTVGDTVYVVKK